MAERHLFGWLNQREEIPLPVLVRELNRRLRDLNADFESGTIVLRDASGNIVHAGSFDTETPLTIRYDADNYVTFTVSSAGSVTVNAVGASAALVFSDGVTINAAAGVLAGSTSNAFIVRTTGAVNTTLQYDASNRLDVAVSSAGAVTFDAVGASAACKFNDPLTAQTTAGPQMYIAYDASNYVSVNVSSAGLTTYDANGASAKHLFSDDVDVASGKVYRVNGTQVVSAQGAAIANPTGGVVIDSEARTAIDAILARIEAHGLIAV